MISNQDNSAGGAIEARDKGKVCMVARAASKTLRGDRRGKQTHKRMKLTDEQERAGPAKAQVTRAGAVAGAITGGS